MNEIHQEIEALWKQASSLTTLDSPYDPKFGETLDEYSKKAKDIGVSHLQPWLAILEQAISWLMALHLALTNGAKPKSDELRVAWVLTGAACSQAVAIRKLCLYGLDVPAKAVLRTLIETLNACIVTTYNEELRRLFREAEDFEQAKKVWRKHFTHTKVQKQLETILEEYELEAEVHKSIKLWQEEEINDMSHGELTAQTARYLSQNIDMDGCTTLFDHGNLSSDPTDQVGNISSWFGEKYSSLSQLALLDIAIIETETNRAIALFEIEESSSNSKVILGDAFGTLLGDNITFQGQRTLVIGEFTTLIILIRQSKGDQKDKIDYLQSQVESLSKHINSGNALIGRVYIDTYLGELDLLQKAKDHVLESLASYTNFK